MSAKRKRTGRILESGRVSAKSIADALGLGGPEPIPGKPKLTPAQQRAKDEGKPLPPDAPDFEQTTIRGGRDVWEYLGRPAAEPPPGYRDGDPLPEEFTPREHEDTKADWEAHDARERAREVAREYAETRRRLESLLDKEANLVARREARARAGHA